MGFFLGPEVPFLGIVTEQQGARGIEVAAGYWDGAVGGCGEQLLSYGSLH